MQDYVQIPQEPDASLSIGVSPDVLFPYVVMLDYSTLAI